ncbi:VIT domain-containing protein [Mycobacterium sp.]|uniref:VIT domain-containing protein n=1 Tax=Mycobacterium sp. TaxID=1785 RepID=UPI003C715FD9
MVHTPVFDTTAPPRLADDPGFGYMSSQRGNLPLEDVTLHADIAGLAASVDLRATFSNDGVDPVEATYVFPLPELAAVSSLQIRTGSTVLDGWLMERTKARDTYAASRVERDAAILEQEREDVVTIRVGTIAPHERVEVRLILHARLTYTDGQVLFRFPLVVAPRYIPGARLGGDPVGKGTAADTDLVPDASRLTPPVASEGRVRLSVSISVASGAYAIDEIGCTLRTHISSAQSDQLIRIEALPGQRLDRDLVLRMRLGAHRQPSLSLLTSVDSDGQEGTFALTLLPPTIEATTTAGRDVVVVVDASASMSGWRLPAARRAAARIIDSLTPADQFTVLTFADRVSGADWAGAGLVQATERNRFRAIEHLFATLAGGSPVLLAALETAAWLFTDPRRPSILVVITAGQVGNEDEITGAFGPRIAPLRVHAVGIGATVNSALLRQLADAGRGQLLLAESDNALDDLTSALRRLLGPPLLTDFGLVGDGIQLLHNTISPAHPPDIFSGDSMVITGRFRGNPTGCVVVSGTGMDGRPWSSRVNGVAVGGRALTQLWARAFLADLQRKYLRCPIEQAAGLERLIVSTSLRFGVLCRLTALVAVSNAPTRALGAPREVIQSVELPADWVEPEPSLSPYATEYSLILASSRGSAGGRSTPRLDVRTGSGPIAPAPPTYSAAPPMPQSAAQMPESAPPRAAGPPAAPPAMMPAPPTSSAAPAMPSSPPPMQSSAPPRTGWAPSAPPTMMPAPPPGSWSAPPAGPAGRAPSRGPSRRGRYVGVGAGVAAVVLGGTLFGSILLQNPHPTASAPPSTTQSPSSPSTTAVDPRTGAKLSVTLTSQGSGSEVSAQVSGIPGGVPVRMIVVGRDGTRHQIDQWVMNPAGSARRAAATVRTNEIASVAIEGAAGQVYVSAQIT